MKQLILQLDNSKKALYLRIAGAIRQQIKTGRVLPGENMPSARSLAEQLQTNRHTIMAAYQELIAEGWIESKQRQGYRVVAELPPAFEVSQGPQTYRQGKANSGGFPWQLNQPDIHVAPTAAADFRINFSGGTPDISLFPFKEFKSYLSQASDRPPLNKLNYGDNAGLPLLIEQLKIYLRRVRSITDRDIVVVNGSQEALYILSRLLLKPGAKVAVEALGYRPAWQCFSNAGGQLVGIAQDDQGMDPVDLQHQINNHEISLIYLTPLHQYPTTVTLPIARRRQIYQIAAAHRIPIIEDDYDHEFHYRCQPLAPMAAEDPAGLVIYLSTFSKIMYPGIRVGFIATDPTLAAAIVRYRTLINHKSNVLIQDAIGRWMADGAFSRYLRKLTRTYEQRRDLMVAELQQWQHRGLAVDFHLPDGGMALWVNIHGRAKATAQQAAARGIFIQEESQFHLQSANSQDNYIRLGYAGLADHLLIEGVETIAELLESKP